MMKENYVSLQEYRKLFADLEVMKQSLEILYRDLLLIKEGYKITYAVDFYEIRSLAYPAFKSNVSYEKQIARAGLLYSSLNLEKQDVVLLPPYVVELNKHVALVRAGVLQLQSGFENEDLKRRLDVIARKPLVRNAMSDLLRFGKITDEHLPQLRDLLEKEAGELFYLLSGVTGRGIETIRDLLTASPLILQMTPSKWPELTSFIEQEMIMPNSEWYNLLNEIHERTTENNERDAKAIDLVLALNEKLSAEKSLVFIVSDTPRMRAVLKKRVDEASWIYDWSDVDGSCINFNEKIGRIPMLRPIEMFYYSILLRASDMDQWLKNINDELNRIAQVYIWKKNFDEIEKNCGKCLTEERDFCELHNPCSDMLGQLKEYSEVFSERTNALLAANRSPIIQQYLEKIETQRSLYEQKLAKGTFSLIEYLAKLNAPLDASIKQREEELLDQLNNELRRALKEASILVLDVSSSHGKEIRGRLDKFSRTHYRIHFQDEVIVSTLKKLKEVRYTEAGIDLEDISQAIQQLIDRAFEKSLGDEKSLFWATMLICYRLPENAVSLTNLVLSDINTDIRAEYLFLRALAYFEMGDFNQVIEECRNNINEYASQARFYNLCGLAISKTLSSASGYSWNDVIGYIKQAYVILTKFQEDKTNLLGAVVNNLAYFHCRRNAQGDLEQAIGFAKMLKDLSPSYNNEPEILNTLGWVNKTRALAESNTDTRKVYAIQALEDFRHSLVVARKIGVEQTELDEYDKDSRDAEQQLKDMIPLG